MPLTTRPAGDVEARDDPGDDHAQRPADRGDRVGDGEAALVERPADDDAVPGRRSARQRREVVERSPTPPLAITGDGRSRRRTAASPSRSGPPSSAVAAMSVTTNAARRTAKRPSAVGERDAGGLGPAVDGELAAAVVEPDGDGHDARRPRRRAPGRRPPPCPSRRGRRRRRPAPRRRRPARTPPPVCTRPARRPRRRSPRSTARLTRLAGAGRVEVDDVDPRAPRVGERRRHRRPGRRRRRSRGRSRPGAAARPARRAGRSPGTASRHAGTRSERDEVRQQAEPGRGRLLRVELRRAHVAGAERGVDRAAVVARGDDGAGSSGTPCSEWTK